MAHPTPPPLEAFDNWRTAQNGECGQDQPCVLVGDGPDGWKGLQDTKLGPASPTLQYNPQEWTVFIAAVKAGEFD
ncbi:hypothetical protein Lfu02_49700 [Longispora fulva]|uniref:DUF397 domain-containing protein n=1 Tax=Longispora fulva TaxID=619741 RepID=A0A8J7GVP2_9ACTN|nr:DUF397 domain-containing protein [Longispora fulva]MBG6138346.1 hypothetical protein [Longispora fulva]GIG60598.1 hypothetical protein Lfu02_49700 [Longispora fulva]